jgi:hypothetical protein
MLNQTRSIKTHGHVTYVAMNLNYGLGSSERSAKRKKFRGGMRCDAFVSSFWASRCFLSAIRWCGASLPLTPEIAVAGEILVSPPAQGFT